MSKSFLRRTLFETLIILTLAVGCALAVHAFRSRGAVETPPSGEYSPEPFPRVIEFDSARAQFDSEAALFVDARSAEAFEQGHIQGAVSLPTQDFEVRIESFIARIDPTTTIITYCDGPHCNLSVQLAEQLAFAGFERVFHLPDGWGQWQAQRQPTATGSD
jgi:rhodanese-related sulfurtransferase